MKILTEGHQDYSSLYIDSHISHLSAFLFSVFAGRWLMSFWTGTAKIHELYTAACGLYVCWLTIRAVTVLVAWMPQGRRVIFQKVKEWSLMVGFSPTELMVYDRSSGYIFSHLFKYFHFCFFIMHMVSRVDLFLIRRDIPLRH